MQLSWGDRTTLIGLSLIIIGFTWVQHQEHRMDVKRAEEWYREDKKLSDERWADLLGKFHELDKKIVEKK